MAEYFYTTSLEPINNSFSSNKTYHFLPYVALEARGKIMNCALLLTQTDMDGKQEFSEFIRGGVMF